MPTQKILGLDLGPNSLGWTLTKNNKENQSGFTNMGIKVFRAGLDELEKDGKGKSPNVDRREARQTRRLLERRSRRLKNLAVELQRTELFTKGEVSVDYKRHLILNKFDNGYDSPYQLRAKALDKKLSEHELGRALYHLAQRRGFLSNRKSIPKDDEEAGIVKKSISELNKKIIDNGSRTLGEYFASINPKEERIRNRYTSRKMYEDEFEMIWEKQKEFHPNILTDSLKKKIYHIIFHQRPLKSVKHLVGECELEKGKKRAPWALLESQQYRYLSAVNNLIIEDHKTGEIRELTETERNKLIEQLENYGDQQFSKIRKLLGLSSRHTKFNLEFGGEKKLLGNKTSSQLIEVFGLERWNSFSNDEKDSIVDDLRCIVKDEVLKKKALKKWGLNEESADKLCGIRLDQGYCRFSKKAISKILPSLKQGEHLQTIIKELYPERWERSVTPCETLPPLYDSGLSGLRNPIVDRTLSELRHVVNSIIRRYGKPDVIRIELGRDLRQSSKQRQDSTKNMRANEKLRKEAAQKIIDEAGIQEPRPNDILKVLLANECNWECPYTGKPINLQNLLGEYPQFDIEHIIPFDRSLDNSYLNKTLCWAEENRKVKHNRTPYEAYYGTEKWDEIINRVNKFQGKASSKKLRRFKMNKKGLDEFLSNFTARQLNDTRWAAKWAKKYLGLLYGGVNDDGIDKSGTRRVQATSGPITAYLRNLWELNSILSDGPGKSRDDHRHHAIDALVVALTDSSIVKMLNDAAKKGDKYKKRLFDKIQTPWDGFLDDVRDKINNTVTSHRVSKRVRGALHKETFYSPPKIDKDGKKYVHIRKKLSELSRDNIKDIVDPEVREVVRKKLQELEINDPKKAFASEENHPHLKIQKGENKGSTIPIHKVRIRDNLSASFSVGKDHRIRYVKSDNNHHMEILEITDENGKVIKWDAEVVSMFEAYQRKKQGEPIIKRKHGPNKRFLFSLAGGEIIELDSHRSDDRELYVVRTVPQSKQIYFVPINDARTVKDIGREGLTAYPNTLRKLDCQKMVVTPLGEVRYAND